MAESGLSWNSSVTALRGIDYIGPVTPWFSSTLKVWLQGGQAVEISRRAAKGEVSEASPLYPLGEVSEASPLLLEDGQLYLAEELLRHALKRQAGSLCYTAGRGITRQGAPRSSISILLVFFGK
jgi:hypothetical protein